MAYVLITGASSGIGREMAALFAADRHDLIITARSQGKLDDVKRTLEHRYGVHVETVALDLSESDAPQQLHDYTVSQGFEVDHLVNNAGFADWTGFLDADWHRQHEMMQLNMAALAELTYRYGRDMREQGHGRILNISSVASMMAGPYMAMYFASKAFVRSLSEAVSYELRDTGVSVTCVCPGPTSTGFAKAANMRGMNFFTLTKPATASACHLRVSENEAGTHACLPRLPHQSRSRSGTTTPPRSDATGRRNHEWRQPTQPASRIIQEATQRVSLAADHICRNTRSRTLFIKREAPCIC